jgi:hypothetical protein
MVLALLLSLLCAACSVVGDPLVALGPDLDPTPRPTRTPRPPARWRMRFCDAQIAVKRALIVIDQTRNRLEQRGSAAWFEEVGDDLADLAERGLEFLDVVPSWRPARPLIVAERSMLEEAAETGRMIERLGELGRSEPRSSAVRSGMRAVDRRIGAMERAVARARDQGIPCARPDIPTTEEIVGG